MTQKRLWVNVVSHNPTDGVTLELDPTYSHYYVPDYYINLPVKYLKYENGEVYEKTTEEKRIIDLPLKYRELVANHWVEKIQEEKDQIDTVEIEAWQNNKSLNLKIMENIYVDFLETKWTPLLKQHSIIASDTEITVTNTDELTNISYLIQLRDINFDTYNLMASEFQRLKDQIIRLGGIMYKVIHHNLN